MNNKILRTNVIENKYEELLTNIKEYFNNSNQSLMKKRNEIKIIEFENQDYVVKSFKVPNLINKIVYSFFRDSKAQKSFNNSIKISNFVPKPIGFIEFKENGVIHDSYFISENFDYDLTIRELLFDDDYHEKELILKEFAKFTNDLHDNGIYHLDYSPGNILIKKVKDDYIIKIVDVNRMKFINFDINTRAKNFSRIWLNDADLTFIVQEYVKLNSIDYKSFLKLALKYSSVHKEKVNLKKRLKGIKDD